MTSPLGIIGGSGLYAMEGVKVHERLEVPTPFGAPSGPLIFGTLEGAEVVFLARHGEGHRLLPGEIPYRANIWALKHLGVEEVVSISAVGSLQPQWVPGTLAVPDQIVDRTDGRISTFFGRGVVAHVGFADPFCPCLRARLIASGETLGLEPATRGTYVCMEGPAFSTRAESRLHQSWGGDFIGMTQATEAKLAREAELCYATLALVTDFDAWREADPGAEGTNILAVLTQNIHKAQQLLRHLVSNRGPLSSCSCQSALATALITRPEDIPTDVWARLAPIFNKYPSGGSRP